MKWWQDRKLRIISGTARARYSTLLPLQTCESRSFMFTLSLFTAPNLAASIEERTAHMSASLHPKSTNREKGIGCIFPIQSTQNGPKKRYYRPQNCMAWPIAWKGRDQSVAHWWAMEGMLSIYLAMVNPLVNASARNKSLLIPAKRRVHGTKVPHLSFIWSVGSSIVQDCICKKNSLDNLQLQFCDHKPQTTQLEGVEISSYRQLSNPIQHTWKAQNCSHDSETILHQTQQNQRPKQLSSCIHHGHHQSSERLMG